MAWHTIKTFAAAGLCLFAALAVPAKAAPLEVDLALVVAVDISYSMDEEEQELQRDGFADAFRSPLVHDAIRRGMLGRIAVAYVEWAGQHDQRVVVPWTVLDHPESIMAFADRIGRIELRRAQRTSISAAIDFSVALIERSGFEATRKVIDISGDGPNNHGRLILPARDEAVIRGITINGLPILMRQPGYLDIEDLDAYFRDCVIGGTGAFMVPVRKKEELPQAIKTKILMEVAGLTPPEPLVHRAQAKSRPACNAGEVRWNDRMAN